MAKKKKDLEAENQKLLEKLAQRQIPANDKTLTQYMGELQKIAKRARVDTGKIKVVEITDHKNISLWTPWGKRIGPLHRSNAEKTFKLFWELGRHLSADQPTAEQVTAWFESAEGKKYSEDLAKSRKRKEKSRKTGQIEKLAAAIAKMAGVKVEEITNILPPEAVKKLG